MKKIVLLLIVAGLVTQLQAQKIKVTEGNLSAFNGITLFDLSYTYDENLRVGKLTEDEYIRKKMAEAEEAEPGRGERWKQAWFEDRTVHFEPMFTELINKYTAEKDAVFRETLSVFAFFNSNFAHQSSSGFGTLAASSMPADFFQVGHSSPFKKSGEYRISAGFKDRYYMGMDP